MLPYSLSRVIIEKAYIIIVIAIPAIPSQNASLLFEFKLASPPFDKRAKMTARAPDGIEK